MTGKTGGDLKGLFGSQTRTKLLGSLADSREPQTGYFLANKAGISYSKAYGELRKLRRARILETQQEASGYKKYILADDDLRRFLLRRVRMTSASEWFSHTRRQERRRTYERLRQSFVELPDFSPDPESIRNKQEFERIPEKDEVLRRIRETYRREF